MTQVTPDAGKYIEMLKDHKLDQASKYLEEHFSDENGNVKEEELQTFIKENVMTHIEHEVTTVVENSALVAEEVTTAPAEESTEETTVATEDNTAQ